MSGMIINKETAEALAEQFSNKSAQDIIQWTLEKIGAENFILASSMSIEGQVLADMLFSRDKKSRVVFIDTGRLNPELYDIVAWTEKRYTVKIEVISPDAAELEQMVFEKGINLFYDSIENRKQCCEIRKVRPLRKKLASCKAWMTGLKRDDSDLRAKLPKIEWDEKFGLLKINPIADWTDESLWKYVKDKGIKYCPLYDQGYKSIGCAPCTRAVKEGEDARAGRWWWEPRCNSECGLHIVDGRLVRKKQPPE